MKDLEEDGAPPEFVDFISKRCRFYALSPSPLEAPVAGENSLDAIATPVEDEYYENVVVEAWRSMLEWFNVLYANPAHKEMELYVEEPEDETVNLGWPGEEKQ